MKFPAYKNFILPVTFCFAFYAIVGCSSTQRTTKYLDKYDDLSYQDAITVHAPIDAAYNAATRTLEKRGYIRTMNDPQTGIATFELNSPTKLPEDTKQAEMDSKLSTGTIILIALSIILIVGIIIILANSSDDDSKDQKKDTSKGTKTGRIGSNNNTGNTNQNRSGSATGNNLSGNSGHWHHDRYRPISPFIYPFIDPVVIVPSPDPSYLYIVTLSTQRVGEMATKVQLSTERLDLEDGEVIHSSRLENKYLNYGIFDEIGKEIK